MVSGGWAGTQPAGEGLTNRREGGEWSHRPELCDANGRARAPLWEGDGGGDEDIKREAGARRGRRSEALARRGVVALQGRWAGHRAV